MGYDIIKKKKKKKKKKIQIVINVLNVDHYNNLL